ncbi:MAG: hypothetical protein NC548_05760 [Lachnospiraceae bacterium]|nr:hypothetical protein [Lachnospiraceae bacterium]
MARIQHVEKAQFINSVIDIYTQNKLGQYSKILDKNPLFVTYYHICQPLSRVDVGTGGIESEIGPRSPIRFNKILDFPIYNLPELKPDIVYDETGYDIELEASDITILPGTIKPLAGDYFVLDIPGAKQYLFRVNNLRYNTIQSNDFYLIDIDIKAIGSNVEMEKGIDSQIVDTYQTVFDNIGTEDRCFVKTTDIGYLNSVSDLYYKLRDYYKDAFYKPELNTFTTCVGYGCGAAALWVTDPYLEAFINRSHIYYDEGVENTLVLSPNTLVPDKFELNFSRTLYDALLQNSLEMLARFPYAYYTVVDKMFSAFNTYGYRAITPNLLMKKTPYANTLTPATPIPGADGEIVKFGDKDNENYATKIENLAVDNAEVPVENSVTNIPWYSILGTPKWIPTWTGIAGYMGFDFIGAIKDGHIDTDDYCELIIFNYLHGIAMEYDRSLIIDELEESLHNYYYLPMVIFVLGQQYQKYFKKESAFEL